jgi:hypothetical protein
LYSTVIHAQNATVSTISLESSDYFVVVLKNCNKYIFKEQACSPVIL